MQDRYIPKVQLQADISETKLNSLDDSLRMSRINNADGTPAFKDVMTSMVKNLDVAVKAPDQVLQDAMTGNNADVHDVMIAISKAEIGLNLATQVTTKVVQAYEKVMAIQV